MRISKVIQPLQMMKHKHFAVTCLLLLTLIMCSTVDKDSQYSFTEYHFEDTIPEERCTDANIICL
jgi:hypothetical protein